MFVCDGSATAVSSPFSADVVSVQFGDGAIGAVAVWTVATGKTNIEKGAGAMATLRLAVFFFSQTRTNGTGAIQKAALTKRRRAFSSCLEYFLLVFIYLLLRNEKKKRHQNKLRRPKGKLPKGERKNKNPRKSRVGGASPKRDGTLPRMSQHLVIYYLSQREDRRRDKEHGRKHREDLLVG